MLERSPLHHNFLFFKKKREKEEEGLCKKFNHNRAERFVGIKIGFSAHHLGIVNAMKLKNIFTCKGIQHLMFVLNIWDCPTYGQLQLQPHTRNI